jgi:eukaryotic translation initiation factor 2C
MQFFRQFAKRFIQECITKGMQIGDPSDIGGIVANENEMEKKFKAAQSAHCEFMLFIHDDREKAGHSIFKLLERRYDIPTQGVRLSTVNNIFQKRQNQTMENVVNKTNVKMGGLNFSLSLNPSCFKNLLSDDILYIGFAISKPAGGLSTGSSAPDVLGYAANIKQFPFEFIGDFSFVTSGIESNFKLETFGEIIKRCVVRFRESRKKNPRHVIIYRHGCDDGLFRTVIFFVFLRINLCSSGDQIRSSIY